MDHYGIGIKDLESVAPFSQGSTEIFLTGHWSSRKPYWVDKTSPCREACPIGIDIARAFYLASKGAYDEALEVYRHDNPLPGVCGRVCYHPCETNCNRKHFDEPVNIRGFERFLSDKAKVDMKDCTPACRRKERIAVVGSGPAGLSAAYHLAGLGFAVTIFESLPEPGGMLMYGIPEYRLPKAILRKEIGHIKRLGVKIKTGVRVGKDVSLSEIRRTHQAVFIAVGTHAGIRLGIEGEDLAGVVEGIKFLRSVNSKSDGGLAGQKIKIGKRVAVIGGGNTAIDCARAARRLGAKEVTIVYRRTSAEMPALQEDVTSAEAEGIKLLFLAAPTRVIPQDNLVSGVECLRMELGDPDESGRPRPVSIKGSEFILPVDTVLSAVGQAPETDFAQEIGLSIIRGGLIETSPDTLATNVEGVFAGGDSAGAKAFVADAIASGKMGALAVSCYLDGKDIKKEFLSHQIGDRPTFSFRHFVDPDNYKVDLKKIASFDKINTLCFAHGPRTGNPDKLKPKESVKSFEEVAGGVSAAQMPSEISRCFKCGTCTNCDLCFYLCPDISIVKHSIPPHPPLAKGGQPACPADRGDFQVNGREDGYSVKADYCKGCSICAATCPRNVIEIEMGGAR